MLILTDLDDTLFQTARKCPADGGNLLAMSTLADGTDSGFATTRQQRLLAWLEAGRIVPVTARSRDVLARVRIGQAPAICSNGGCIVGEDGEPDQAWHGQLDETSRSGERVGAVYRELVSGLDDEAFRHWTVEEMGLDLYIVVKSNRNEGDALDAVEARARTIKPERWRIHRNGNNLAILPPWLNKRNAAEYLIGKARILDPYRLIVGLGDSHSDVGFMDLCDFAMTPTSSQLWELVRRENDWC